MRKPTNAGIWAAMLVAVVLTPVAARAEPATPTLTVTAEGKVARAPDIAEVSGGVVTQAPTAAAAMVANARQMTDVVAAIRRAGVADRDVQTSGLSLQPQYRYENNQPPLLTGYQATNTVSLRIRRLPDTGRLLDALVAAGANQLNGPSFRIDAADAALDEARTAAVRTARARAELYAAAAGLHVRRIVSISESGGTPEPRPMMIRAMMKSADSAETPVAPGEVTLAVNVTIVFELQ